MNNISTFNVTVDGETVSISLERARSLCPVEVANMEVASKRLSDATEQNDVQKISTSGKELEQQTLILLHVLAEKARQIKNAA